MLSHAQIWAALDALAARNGLSPSGLARKAGLDPTAFNKSKRIAADGRPRWPSTESIAKVLAATSTSLDLFMSLVSSGPRRAIPLIGFAQAGDGGYFDDSGLPTGTAWDEVEFPQGEQGVYALEIAGESMLPAYRDGDIILVSPAAPVRRGDRVVVKTKKGELLVNELKRQTAKQVELKPLNPAQAERTLAHTDLVWMARIVWASQ